MVVTARRATSEASTPSLVKDQLRRSRVEQVHGERRRAEAREGSFNAEVRGRRARH
jgi:hypothetical protein